MLCLYPYKSAFHCSVKVLYISNLKEKKNLFWIIISKVLVHGHLTPRLKLYAGGKPLTSWQRGSRENDKEGKGKELSIIVSLSALHTQGPFTRSHFLTACLALNSSMNLLVLDLFIFNWTVYMIHFSFLLWYTNFTFFSLFLVITLEIIIHLQPKYTFK